MKTRTLSAIAAFAFATTALAGTALARDQIRIVGSSTVYPFTTAVAEQFGKTGSFKTPVVESTGTGGGFKLFCEGVGEATPDVSNASRAITKGEFETCAANGVTDIVQLEIGFDGLVMANAKSGPDLKLTRTQVFLALAKQVPGPDGKLIDNPYVNWSDIDPSLPAIKIEVLGPPPTSGTRDSFLELYMDQGARGIESLAALRKEDSKAYDVVWKSLREDGAWIDAGENDNLIVQKLESNPNAVGVFGFSFLEENMSSLKGAEIEGVVPTFETIAAKEFKGARPLFVYFKKQHVGVVPGLQEFINEYASEKALGDDGYLAAKGLVPLPADQRAKQEEAAKALETISAPTS
ncbi:MAG TPA: substrate-binding domain-containing protein [Bauldia sp.]|nr:substrate-binding domain-containing protein [Bauldia sp.]